jgi:hypothetical protein
MKNAGKTNVSGRKRCFDRQAPSLEEAIASAVVQVQAADLVVSKVELDVDAAVSLGA